MFFSKKKQDNPEPASVTRQIPPAEAFDLPPGADHYRAYVGPANRFDFMSGSQFALLFALGLRDHHKVLDFGCGSLRLGRLLIPFLQDKRYYGIDPNAWLIEESLSKELGRDILQIKHPSFSHNDDFSTEVFSTEFDFIMAQSILTHTGPSTLRAFLQSSSKTLSENGLLLFSYVRAQTPDSPLPEDGWYYPECVPYTERWIIDELKQVGLHGLPIPWFHPGAAWIVAGRSDQALPDRQHLNLLTGSMLRETQFADSIPNTQA